MSSVPRQTAPLSPPSQRAFDALFKRLDPGVPLLLLPVRIETLFDLPGDVIEPPGRTHRAALPRRTLLVRIYPDDVHADTHARGLTRAEIQLGQRFWKVAWPQDTGRDPLDRAFARLVSRLGAFRAAWVVEITRPVNWDRRGSVAKGNQPRFADPPMRDAVAPGKARLLPDRWIVTGYQNGELVFAKEGKPIPRDLAISPDLAATGQAPTTMAELLETQGLGWRRTFQAAEAAGMATRIPLPQELSLDQPLDLFVLGARTGEAPEGVARRFAALLAAHHWTHGVDFVRRGTPTNNSDRASSGVSLSEADSSALLDSILVRPDARDRTSEPIFRRRFDAAAGLALGFEPGSILERVGLRDDAQLDLAAAMSAALWPATWGHFLRTMIAGALGDEWISWTRRHFIANVRGGGLLPAIRLGSQPYALHPVALEARREQPADRLDTLENLLLDLLPAWNDAVAHRVARFDVEATDTPDDTEPDPITLGEATATLARILGATPNPSDLTITPVTNQVALYELRWNISVFLLDLAIAPSFPSIASQLGSDLAAAATLEQQIATLEAVIESGDASTPNSTGALWSEAHSSANDEATRAAAQSAIDLIAAYILPLLYNHRDRSRPLIDLGPDRAGVTGVMADDSDPPLFFSFFGESAERLPWTGALVARNAAASEDVRAWLDALVVEARDPSQPAAAPGEHAPLLFQLLKRAIANAHPDDRADMLAGLQTLASASGDGRLDDPVGDLETLMGEVLGTCMHRIDAWLAGSAAERLAAARRERPRGIEIGGYGWVLGLAPAAAPAPSQGFIHAPSLDHAATAAILRSGWSALGDGALGVDISSARARAASWIVDGVRDGHRLGELLGQALERRLHDAFLDPWVDKLRSAVLAGMGRAGAQPSAIVDGFVLARAWTGGDDVAPLTAEEGAVRVELRKVVDDANDEKASLQAVLDLHGADFDALADANLFESVHAVVRGNPDRAAATLAATGTASSAPPPLTALRTTRGGRRITHRVILLLDGGAGSSGPTSPDAVAEPALDAWIATVLPLAEVGFGAWTEENGTKTWQGPYALGNMGLGALDLLTDLPPPEVLVTQSTLARRLAWRLEREAAGAGRMIRVTIDAELTGGDGGGHLPLAVAVAAAQSLRALVYGGRAADDSDLATTTVDSTADVATTAAREAVLAGAAREAAERLRVALDGAAATAELIDSCAALAAWHVSGAIPRAGLADLATGSDAADRDALRAEAEASHRRMQARIDARDTIQGADLGAAIARIRALLPGAVVLPPFAPVDIDALRSAASRSTARLGAPEEALPWLHQVGRVREHVHAAAAAVDLVEAVAGRSQFQPALIQLPDHPEEGWAATSLPTLDASPRTCILSLTPMPASATLAGIAIDAWAEAIPDTLATTGIAVHFDAPSARAPQAWLLATPPRSRAWTFDEVLAVVRQTLDRARQRAAGPADVEGFGQYLPAIYLADTTDVGPTAARADAR